MGLELAARPLVEVEEQRGLPGVPDARAHAAMVRVGEQHQQVELLDRAHARGERQHGRGLRQVALLRGLRHLEVRAHQEDRLPGDLVLDPEPGEDAARDDAPLLDVAAAPALGDVVQQHAEVERPHVLELVEQARERRRLRVLSRGQLVERVDGAQRVLVHRVLVEEVVLDQEADPRPLRQQPPQDTRLVHARETRRPPGRGARRAAAGRGPPRATGGSGRPRARPCRARFA